MISLLAFVLLQTLPAGRCELERYQAVSACQAGSSECCAKGALFLSFRRDSDPCEQPNDVQAGVKLLEKGCHDGDGLSCLRLGNGAGTDEFPEAGRQASLWARAATLLGKECDSGRAAACLELAQQFRAGLRLPHDEQRAANFQKRGREIVRLACHRGGLAACEEGAQMDMDEGVSVDESLAVLAGLCDQGRVSACGRMTPLIGMARSPRQQDVVKGMLRRGCSLGSATACNDLAEMGRREGLLSDAINWSKKACSAGDGHACHLVADAIIPGSKADEWRTKGCASGVFHLACPPPPGQCVSPQSVWPLGSPLATQRAK